MNKDGLSNDIKEKLSAYIDNEISEKELNDILSDKEKHEAIINKMHRNQVISESIKNSSSLFLHVDLSNEIRSKIQSDKLFKVSEYKNPILKFWKKITHYFRQPMWIYGSVSVFSLFFAISLIISNINYENQNNTQLALNQENTISLNQIALDAFNNNPFGARSTLASFNTFEQKTNRSNSAEVNLPSNQTLETYAMIHSSYMVGSIALIPYIKAMD